MSSKKSKKRGGPKVTKVKAPPKMRPADPTRKHAMMLARHGQLGQIQ